jgi:microsomal dipeptidase-like Zn-dependent dipeptidase
LQSVTDQAQWVEDSIEGENGVICPIRTRDDLDWATEPATGRLGLIHCVEGGHVLGAEVEEVPGNVRTLADLGVAYVTVAHLFWRQVATNAPALPFLPDWLYRLLFFQPQKVGLSELGRAAIVEMFANRILVDVTHMSHASVTQTLDLLDDLDPTGDTPVIATHGACRFPERPRFRQLDYNLRDETIKRIAERGGVIGLIACKHYISRGLRLPWFVWTFGQSVKLLCRHIDHIAELTGSYDHVGIGTDLDGFIKPALPGLKDSSRMAALQDALVERYDTETAKQICSGNALRVLRHRFR